MSLDNPGGGSSGGGGLSPLGPAIQNTYIVDPKFARHFTTAWGGLLALFVLVSVPRLYRSIYTGRIWQSLGFWENAGGYRLMSEKSSLSNDAAPPSVFSRRLGALRAMVHGPTLYSVPKTQLDLGQVLVVVFYYGILLVCLFVQSDLRSNSNRAGFLVLAQLPAVFLFGVKNSPLHYLLGQGYEKFNVLHRWSGRGMWLMATIHGSLWINQYRHTGLTSYLSTTKPRLGMAAYGTLCMIVILSLRPVRARYYQLFFISHVVAVVTFFVIICYHTPYASPWIYPPIAFYGFDLVTRMFRFRVKDATLESHDTLMTLVHVPDVHGGWVAGQHVQLRVFSGTMVYESHSLTILNAPPAISALGDLHPGGLTLGARVCGDWTRKLNTLAQNGEKGRERVNVLLDGPYGGSSLDFGSYESVLLVSGGSGVTFTLGILDDLVGRIVKLGRPNGERTRRITFAWYIRSFGAIAWFERHFMAIANAAQGSGVELSFRFFVTCLCDPEAVAPIPGATVEVSKPSIAELLAPLLDASKLGAAGGVGVGASGPESLTRSAQNAVAKIGPSRAASAGGVELHTELFAL